MTSSIGQGQGQRTKEHGEIIWETRFFKINLEKRNFNDKHSWAQNRRLEQLKDNEFKKESPVQNIIGCKVDLRKIADYYNSLMKSFKNNNEWDKHMVLFNFTVRKVVNKIVNSILYKYPNTFITEIGDHSSVGSFLEHNYEWKVKHIKISNH